jgi:hypothetical protein
VVRRLRHVAPNAPHNGIIQTGDFPRARCRGIAAGTRDGKLFIAGGSGQNAAKRTLTAGKIMAHYDRRLSDKLLAAFDQACDQKLVAVAELLLRALETVLTNEGGAGVVDKRQDLGPVIAAYARLKELQDVNRLSRN